MFHSTLVSEPLALVVGLIFGLLGSALAASMGLDHTTQMWVGGTASTVANFAIGAPINMVAIDLLALIVMRPVSPVIAFSILQALT